MRHQDDQYNDILSSFSLHPKVHIYNLFTLYSKLTGVPPNAGEKNRKIIIKNVGLGFHGALKTPKKYHSFHWVTQFIQPLSRFFRFQKIWQSQPGKQSPWQGSMYIILQMAYEFILYINKNIYIYTLNICECKNKFVHTR